VAGAVHRRLKEHEPPKPRALKATAQGQPTGMIIDGVGDLLSSFAKCCRPVPPETIAGYITLGRGVSIHRADCANLLRLRDAQPRRVLDVDWGRPSPERTFPVGVVLHAFDRRALARDISSVLADEHIAITAMNMTTNPAENTATVDMTVTVHGLDELSRLLSRLSSLPNVISARRRH
jgi:GTP pyrophosphokinase